jgi:hypothetical protein
MGENLRGDLKPNNETRANAKKTLPEIPKKTGSWAGHLNKEIMVSGIKSIPKPNPPAPIIVYKYINFNRPKLILFVPGILLTPHLIKKVKLGDNQHSEFNIREKRGEFEIALTN